MTDIVDSQTRSRMMAGIRGKDTKPELIVRRFLHRAGLRFRLHAKLPGKPDLVLPKHRAAVFVHGCFWHGHDCARGSRQPKTNADYWIAKIGRNRARDAAAVTAGARTPRSGELERPGALRLDPSLRAMVRDYFLALRRTPPRQ